MVSGIQQQSAPMTIKVNEKITRTQNKLFELAHASPLELKHLAIRLGEQGIDKQKWYCYPGMLPLPVHGSNFLKSLSQSQKSILSAIFFVSFYKYVCNTELYILVSNMAVAEKVFAPYSDEYMILFQETSEEMDHIWTFKKVHDVVCQEVGVPKSFASPGVYNGLLGGGMPHMDFATQEVAFTFEEEFQAIFPLLKQGKAGLPELLNRLQSADRTWRYRLLYFLTGDAIRLLPADLVQEMGLGSLWLFYRYISNVDLKQLESFLFYAPDKVDYDPLAYQINQSHLRDEARHYTTSFELALAMFHAASIEGQAFVKEIVRIMLEDSIIAHLMTNSERIDEMEKPGNSLTFLHIQLGLDTLEFALNHPEFANQDFDRQAVLAGWRKVWPPKRMYALEVKRARYLAQQFDRLIRAMDIELDHTRMGPIADRLEYVLHNEPPEHYVDLAS